MRSTVITTAATIALFSLSAGPAAARTDFTPEQVDAANHATAMRELVIQHQREADTVSAPPQTARIVRVPVADTDFDWADGAIGAGLTAALLLGVAGVGTARRHASIAAHRPS
jgi:hypothetical protein